MRGKTGKHLRAQQCFSNNVSWFSQALTSFLLFVFSLGKAKCKGDTSFQYDAQAFLFSLVNKPGWGPLKLTQTGSKSGSKYFSMFNCPYYSVTFGFGHDLYISTSANENTASYTNLGTTYTAPRLSQYSVGSTFIKTFMAGSFYFSPDEIETFYETK